MEFRSYYTYTEGSPEVACVQEFYTYDLETGDLKGAGSCSYTYTMLSPDNYVEMWCGWEGTGELDENGLEIQRMPDYNGTEYAPDGSVAREIPATAP